MPDLDPAPVPVPARHVRFAALLGGLGVAVLLLWLQHAIAARWLWWREPPFWRADLLRLEIPLTLALFALLAWPAGRSRLACFLGGLAAGVPLLGIHLAIDLHAQLLDRVPTPDDAALLVDLLRVDPLDGALVILGLLLLAAAPLAAFLAWLRGRSRSERLLAVGTRVALAVVLATVFWAPPSRVLWADRLNLHDWSDQYSLKDRGHLATCWGAAARIAASRERLAGLPPPVDAPRLPTPGPRRANAWLVLLESFVDARTLEPPVADAIHPDLLPFLAPGGLFDTCRSPVFGGRSAQAEFELLTGAPALALAGPVEYLAFTGRPADALPAAAAAAGYRTVVAYGAAGAFFGAATVHRTLGFGEGHYTDRDPWLTAPPGQLISDTDLLPAVRAGLAAGRDPRPTLTLVVGMEGHFVSSHFPRDRGRFPDVAGAPDPLLRELADVCYWRSRALASFLASLARDDPTAVVLVVGDHQPSPLAGPALRHPQGRHAVPALLFAGGQRVSVDGRRLRELPWLVWGLMTGAPAEVPPPEALRRRYEAILAGQLGK